MAINIGKPLDEVEVAEPTGSGPMPEGFYYGIIEAAEERQSKAGNDMIELTVKLTGNERYDGKMLWYYIVFGREWSLEQLKKVCISLGINTQGLTQVSASMFTDKSCKFKVKHDTYEGETKEKLHYFVELDKEIAVPDAGLVDDDDSEIPF